MDIQSQEFVAGAMLGAFLGKEIYEAREELAFMALAQKVNTITDYVLVFRGFVRRYKGKVLPGFLQGIPDEALDIAALVFCQLSFLGSPNLII